MKHQKVFEAMTLAMGREEGFTSDNDTDFWSSTRFVGHYLGMSVYMWGDLLGFSMELTHVFPCVTTLYIATRLGVASMDDLFDPSEMPESIDTDVFVDIPEAEAVTLRKPTGADDATIELVQTLLQKRVLLEGLEDVEDDVGYELKVFLRNPITALGEYNLGGLSEICTAANCDWLAVLKDLHQRYMTEPNLFPSVDFGYHPDK